MVEGEVDFDPGRVRERLPAKDRTEVAANRTGSLSGMVGHQSNRKANDTFVGLFSPRQRDGKFG